MSGSQIFSRSRIGPGGGVDVWSAPSDMPAQRLERPQGLLSDHEWQRAVQYRCAQSRAAFIAGRAMLRLALSEYTQTDPSELRLGEGKNGKLELRRPTGHDVQFSLSHADTLTLLAITCGSRVGIDVERLRLVPEAYPIIARFASPAERAAWRRLPPEQRQHAFFRWWTRKEALLKATGDGLSADLGAFDVPFSPGDDVCQLPVGGAGATAARWSLVELLPAPGYLASLAIEHPLSAHR